MTSILSCCKISVQLFILLMVVSIVNGFTYSRKISNDAQRNNGFFMQGNKVSGPYFQSGQFRSIYPMGSTSFHNGVGYSNPSMGGYMDYSHSFNGRVIQDRGVSNQGSGMQPGYYSVYMADGGAGAGVGAGGGAGYSLGAANAMGDAFDGGFGIMGSYGDAEDSSVHEDVEDQTGHGNRGLDAALRHGTGGLAGLAGAAGLEGGLGQGAYSRSMSGHPITSQALLSIDDITEIGGPNDQATFRQEIANNLANDISNGRVGGLVGSLALNGHGGLTGAAGLGKVIGNEPGFGSNLGAMASIATSSGLNGYKTMSPKDLGSEGKECLGATSKVAAAGMAGEGLGIKAGLNAGITDAVSLETLAGLGQGMAVAEVLDDHAKAIKSQGIEGPAAKVAGYAGIPGSGGAGSYASLLGMGPSGTASKAAASKQGLKGGDAVAENAAFNDVRLIKRLNDDIQRKKEDVIEDTLKKKMLEADLEEELKT